MFSLTELKDDPYRSLAYFVRKKGGYDKTKINLAEFYLAAFYKKFITLRELKLNWEVALKKPYD